jgi:hypothetical protein
MGSREAPYDKHHQALLEVGLNTILERFVND